MVSNYDGGNLTLKVLVMTIDAQWEGMGDVGLVRYKLALLPPCPQNSDSNNYDLLL